ncbi:MAG: glycosyltransferase family 4 protein [Acidimicrobiales bacterium]|nr:glycosyltransferase family 4 protein [Acidimicrobiales bacterium]
MDRFARGSAAGFGDSARSRPLHVAIISGGWPPETFIDRLVRGLRAAGTEITFVSSAPPPQTYMADLRASWIPGPDRPNSRAMARLVLRSASPTDAGNRLRGMLRTTLDGDPVAGSGADVLYVPWINSLTADLDIFELGIPVVTSCRGSLVTVAPWNPRRHAHRDALRTVFERSAAVHCVSESIAADAARWGLRDEKVRIIRPAIDPDSFPVRTGNATGALRAVAVGNLGLAKNYEHAIRAVGIARDLGFDVELRIVGKGPDSQHLRYTIDDLGLVDCVQLLGPISADGVGALLRDSDVFLHTSFTEGISNAVLEAMATALPVVTTDAGGMAEAVRDGVDGFVVPVRSPEITARRLGDLASDPGLRRRFGDSGRERVERHFRLADQIESFTTLFHEVAGR